MKGLDLLIQSKEEEVCRLKELAKKTASVITEDKVIGGKSITDKMASRVCAYSDIEREIEELRALRNEISSIISKVFDNDQELLLRLRYVDDSTWRYIAYKMGYESISSVHRLHKKALGSVRAIMSTRATK